MVVFKFVQSIVLRDSHLKASLLHIFRRHQTCPKGVLMCYHSFQEIRDPYTIVSLRFTIFDSLYPLGKLLSIFKPYQNFMY